MERLETDTSDYNPDGFLRNSLKNFYQFERQMESAVPVNMFSGPSENEMLKITKKYSK